MIETLCLSDAGSTPVADPEIRTCCDKLDTTIRQIYQYQQDTLSSLVLKFEQVIANVTAVLGQVTTAITQTADALLRQVTQSGTAVTSSLAAQLLSQLTELILRLQRSGIPLPSVAELQGGPLTTGGTANAGNVGGTTTPVLANGVGGGTLLPGSQVGGGTTYGGITAGGGAGGAVGTVQPFGTTGTGGTTVSGNTGALTPVTPLDRLVIVNSDGSVTPADLFRDPERPGVVWVYPSGVRLSRSQVDTLLPAPVSSPGYSGGTSPVAPLITPGLSGAGAGGTASAPAGVSYATPDVQRGVLRPTDAGNGIPGANVGSTAGPVLDSFAALQETAGVAGADPLAVALDNMRRTDFFVQAPDGKNYTVTGAVLVKLYDSTADKIDTAGDRSVLDQLINLFIPGGRITGQAATRAADGIAGVFDPPGSPSQSCPPIQITLNPSFGTGVPQQQGGTDCTNPVGIEQPYAFRFEQRQKPWFRDAITWGGQELARYVNAASADAYFDELAQLHGSRWSQVGE